MNLGMTVFSKAFYEPYFHPQTVAYNHDAVLMLLYVVADIACAIAYTAIALVLFFRRHYIVNLTPAAFTLYGTFIGLAACHHYTQVLLQFLAVYRLDIMVLMLIAAHSCVTAALTVIAVFPNKTKS